MTSLSPVWIPDRMSVVAVGVASGAGVACASTPRPGAAGDQQRAEQKNRSGEKLKTFHQNSLLSGGHTEPTLTGTAAVSGCRSTTTNMATMSSAFGIGQNMPGFVMEMSSMAK